MATEPIQRKATPHSGTKLVHRVFASVPAAEQAFERLLELGVDAARVSVVARGVAVDQRLVRDEEMNANSAAKLSIPVDASALARKLSTGKRHLLEGCWITGPIVASGASSQEGDRTPDCEDVKLLLTRAGLPPDQAARVEAEIQGSGGVWLGVAPSGAEAVKLERALGST